MFEKHEIVLHFGVHLEEDTARSQHDKGEGSLVDYNRAGVPLMELVTEPVIHDAESAGKFARELQLLLRTIGISDAKFHNNPGEEAELRRKIPPFSLKSFHSFSQPLIYLKKAIR